MKLIIVYLVTSIVCLVLTVFIGLIEAIFLDEYTRNSFKKIAEKNRLDQEDIRNGICPPTWR